MFINLSRLFMSSTVGLIGLILSLSLFFMGSRSSFPPFIPQMVYPSSANFVANTQVITDSDLDVFVYLPIAFKDFYPPPSPPINISNTANSSSDPAIAADRLGGVHVVWIEGDSTAKQLYYTQKPSGQAWSTPTPLPISPGQFLSPTITIDKALTVHVVWVADVSSGGELHYAFKALNQTWSSRVISSIPTNLPNISLASDCEAGAHLVWAYPVVNYEPSSRWWLYHTRFNSDGTIPDQPVFIGFSEAIHPVYPDIAVGVDCTIHLAYNDWAGNNTKWDIFYRVKPKDGAWASPQNITPLAEDAHAPAITVEANGIIHVMWDNFVSNGNGKLIREIFYTNKLPGQSWLTPEKLTNNSEHYNSSNPIVAVNGNRIIHALWSSSTNIGGCPVPGGASLGPEPIDYMYKPVNKSWQVEPYLACRGSDPDVVADMNRGRIHMVWADGDGDIYYSSR